MHLPARASQHDLHLKHVSMFPVKRWYRASHPFSAMDHELSFDSMEVPDCRSTQSEAGTTEACMVWVICSFGLDALIVILP
jgi:hypothetical protein